MTFGDVHGMFTPQWWPQNWNQYGLLKLLVINDYGTYIDGLKISDVSTLSLHLDYNSDIRLRLAVENDSEHVGGITLDGKSFGKLRSGHPCRHQLCAACRCAAVAGDFFRAVV